MKILMLSNSTLSSTGYGTQTALFVPRLRALGHEVAVNAFYGVEGSVMEINGIRHYPRFVHPYGADIVGAHAQHFGADLILTLTDAWILEPTETQGIPMACWAPVDHEPIPPLVADKLRKCLQPIAYSRFGETEMRKAGLDPRYVPHGVDINLFAPSDRMEARRKVGLPTDKFIIGMVGANKGICPVRKSFAEVIAAFARLKRKHADVLLYLHTNLDEPDAWQPTKISLIAENQGLKMTEDIAFVGQYPYFCQAVSPMDMATLYNAFDVLVSPSRGEGFGLPILEAQACGTPVITGAWTAMTELTFSGWAIPKDEAEPEFTPQWSWMFKPRIGAIAERFEWAYKQAGSQSLREQARAGAMPYNADRVALEYWKPVLAELEQRLAQPVEAAGPLGQAA